MKESAMSKAIEHEIKEYVEKLQQEEKKGSPRLPSRHAQ
jgi:hypothetical protein